MKLKPLNRRTFLKSSTATIALPFLEAMLFPTQSWAATNQRFMMLYMGNGMMSGKGNGTNDMWNCQGSAAGITAFSVNMQLLSAYKDYLTIVTNVADGQCGNNDMHFKSATGFSTGQSPAIASTGQLCAGQAINSPQTKLQRVDQKSIDRFIAAKQTTTLSSLMMGVGFANGSYAQAANPIYQTTSLSWDSQTNNLASQTLRTAADVFLRLTGSGLIRSQSTVQSASFVPASLSNPQKVSILDSVIGDINKLMGRLGAADRRTMDEYLTALRQVEKDLGAAVTPTPTPTPGPTPTPTPMPNPNTCMPPDAATQASYTSATSYNYAGLTKVAQQMMDLTALAFQCGITNVASLMLSYDWSTVNPVSAYGAAASPSGTYHDDTHYANDATKLATTKLVNTWHARQFAYLAQKLKSISDSDGRTLLDNSLVLFGAGMGDPDEHRQDRMMRVILGRGTGLNPGVNGKIITADGSKSSHAALLQTILTRFAVTTVIGDSGGKTISGI